MEDMLGIEASSGFWLGFAAHAVDPGKPFYSETGFRSFLGVQAPLQAEISPEVFATQVLESHFDRPLRRRLAPLAAWPRMRAGQDGHRESSLSHSCN